METILYQNSDLKILYQNYLIGDPLLTFGVRKLKLKANKDDKTRSVFPTLVPGNSYDLFKKLDRIADTDVIYLSPETSSKVNHTTVNYVKEQNGHSLQDVGGHIVYFSRNRTKAFDQFAYLTDPNLVSMNWVNMYFNFVYINPNYDAIVSNVIHFERFPSGEIEPHFNQHTLSFRYKTPFQKFRILLEVIFLIMTTIHLYWLIKDIIMHFWRETERDLKQQPERMKKSYILIRLLGIDPHIRESDSCWKIMFYFIKWFIFFICRFIYMIVKVSLNYCTVSIFNLAYLLQMMSILAQIVMWIRIFTEDEFTINQDGTAPGAFAYTNNVVESLLIYNIMVSSSMLLLSIHLISCFNFSSKLTMFYEILDRASFEILLFIIMFAIVITAFALMGFFLFGVSDSQFRSFGLSLVTLFLMAKGSVSSYNIHYSIPAVKHVYGIAFVATTLILLNMLVAIIISHYIEYYYHRGHLKFNIIKLIIRSFIEDKKPDGNEGSNSFKKFVNYFYTRLYNWSLNIRPKTPEYPTKCK